MRTRKSLIRKQFNYEAEMARPMCQGCTKASGTLVHYCTMYNRVAPKIFVDANECPHNYRRKRINKRGRVGQQKQGAF